MKFRVIDYETTGFPPDAGIVEIGWCDVDISPNPDGSQNIVVGKWQSEITNPSMKIEIAALAVHHITEEDIKDARRPAVVMAEVCEGVDYFVAHNAKFEKEFYNFPVPIICTLKLAYRLCPSAPNHQNQTIRYFLKTPCDRDMAQPSHRAGPDAYVTAHTFAKFLTTKMPIEKMVEISNEPPLFPYCPIGKHRGKPWADVDAGFLMWCLRQPSMEADIKWNVQREIDRRKALNQ